MAEAVIRQRLIRLSCAKLLAFKKSSEGLRRSLQILTVLKHAHSDEARFEPECSDLLHPQPHRLVVILEHAPPQQCSDLLHPQPHRLVVILEHAPPQRITSSSSPPPTLSSPPTSDINDHIVPSTDNNEEPIEIEIYENNENDSMMEMDDEDGTSMARKRKNHTSNILDYNGEKRHCENSFDTNSSLSSSGGYNGIWINMLNMWDIDI
uniref:Uncharacterized protein n=1 Tax=Panagrolaimus sp. PS1159 TaxID=55785 RepID=A0AC35GBH5_9BILA